MRSLMKGSSSGRKEKTLPVFVFPEELQFVASDESAHKQVLTVYNPYEFTIRFQVLSNAPQKYSVLESQGSIKAHCCVDIVIRHKQPTKGPFDLKEKFRIDIYIDRKLAGRKQVVSTLIKERPNSEGPAEKEVERFSGYPSPPHPYQVPRAERPAAPQVASASGPTVLLMGIASVCLFILLLPLEGESPDWPSYSHITVNQKLIAAFALGLVTMAILKS